MEKVSARIGILQARVARGNLSGEGPGDHNPL